ncbi:MAG TPA: hypothetical protein VE988_10785 [Gemmataceae bacterium]|nr:hypothetical protein [Gemmataceae bacterium]
MRVTTYENWARVIHHLDDLHLVVEFTDEVGQPLPYGNAINVLKEKVPPDLRRIGSRFILRWNGILPEDSDSAEGLRQAVAESHEVIRLG